jgi:hypothetical protein
MARIQGSELSASEFRLLHSGEIYQAGDRAALLVTIDAAGRPHPAMLSGVKASDPRCLLVPVHRGSSTLANLERTGLATVLVMEPGLILYLKGQLDRIESHDDLDARLAVAVLRLEVVLNDHDPESGLGTGLGTKVSAAMFRHVEAELRAIGIPIRPPQP